MLISSGKSRISNTLSGTATRRKQLQIKHFYTPATERFSLMWRRKWLHLFPGQNNFPGLTVVVPTPGTDRNLHANLCEALPATGAVFITQFTLPHQQTWGMNTHFVSSGLPFLVSSEACKSNTLFFCLFSVFNVHLYDSCFPLFV